MFIVLNGRSPVVEVQKDLVSQAQGSYPGMATSSGRNVDPAR
jgi:hypothetical protein